MKKTSIIALTILISYPCFAQFDKKIWSDYQLKGKVQSVKEISYSAMQKDGKTIKGDKKREESQRHDSYWLFKNNGKLIMECCIALDDSMNNRIKFQYDSQDSIVEEVAWFCDGDFNTKYTYKYENGKLKEFCSFNNENFISYKNVYIYDNDGKMIELINYAGSSQVSGRDKYTYGSNGMPTKVESYDIDGKLSSKETFLYDPKGLPIENCRYKYETLTVKYVLKYDENGNSLGLSKYGSDGKLESNNVNEYNKKGKVIKQYFYDDSGKAVQYTTYEYDQKGNMIEEKIFNSKGKLGTTNRYNSNGKRIECIRHKDDGSQDSKITNKYDEIGNEIELIYYSEDNTVDSKTTYEFEYDKVGNWVKSTKSKNNLPLYIIEREIVYF